MNVHVLYFAALKEKMNCSERTYDIEAGETVSALADKLVGFHDCLLFAVNDEVVESDYQLQDGDKLAFIPPMAGG